MVARSDPSGSRDPAGLRREIYRHQRDERQKDHDFIDRPAREFAVYAAHGEDVGAALVREGLAFAYGAARSTCPSRRRPRRSAAAPGRGASYARHIFAKAPISRLGPLLIS